MVIESTQEPACALTSESMRDRRPTHVGTRGRTSPISGRSIELGSRSVHRHASSDKRDPGGAAADNLRDHIACAAPGNACDSRTGTQEEYCG